MCNLLCGGKKTQLATTSDSSASEGPLELKASRRESTGSARFTPEHILLSSVPVCVSYARLSTVHVERAELQASRRRTAVEWSRSYLASSAAAGRFKEQRRHVSIPKWQQGITNTPRRSFPPFALSLFLCNPAGLCSPPQPLYDQPPSSRRLPVPQQTALLLGDWRV